MATFQSLTPAMGSHQSRNAPNLFSIELELALPQDHFLPAENIVAEVWTNIIHRLNPDGPEVWAAVPMTLAHVIQGTDIAVFSATLQPTGRGEFGLTARWKPHKDVVEWQWAPAATEEQSNEAAGAIGGGAGQKVNKDVSVTVKVPRKISSSPWALGPQSVMVFGQDGPRVPGMSVRGPGLYLGNHAAATRARISGYESVLSLVGDLLDFDENIPESDKEVNRKAWSEQEESKNRANIAQRQGQFQSLSRSSSVASFGEGGGGFSDTAGSDARGLSRRSSVADFMRNYEPGNNTNTEDIFAAVVDEPVDPPRLSRRSSVTDKMVQPPSSSSEKHLSRSSFSAKSLVSIDRADREGGQQDAPATSAAPNTGSGKISEDLKQSDHDGKSYKEAPVSQKKNDSTPAAVATLPQAPVSEKSSGNSGSNKKKKGKKDAGADAAALPPVSGGKGAKVASPTVTSLDVSIALESTVADVSKPQATLGGTDKGTKGTNGRGGSTAGEEDTAAAESKSNGSKDPASTTKVVPGLNRQSSEKQQADSSSLSYSNFSSSTSIRYLVSSSSTSSLSKYASPPTSSVDLANLSSSYSSSTLSDPSNRDVNTQSLLKSPFKHKMISIAPGAHNVISDAVLKEAVDFLRTEIALGKRVLVHCRDGNGRSGSVAIAYVASQLERSARQAGRRNEGRQQQQQQQQQQRRAQQKESGGYYEEALEEVWKWKCDVYPNKGLKQSIARIQW